jgi:hypothetical protein
VPIALFRFWDDRVKFVGAVRKFRVNIKYVQIDAEDGTGLVRVILWREEKRMHGTALVDSQM